MKGLWSLLPAVAVPLRLPGPVVAQNPALVGSFRPYLFVLLAFAAGWLLIGAWVVRIGRKVDRLAQRMEEGGGGEGPGEPRP